MPESRPLSSMPNSNFDDPPANDASTPYPNRHTRLRRALRNTNDLAYDVSRDGRSGYSPAVDSHRNTSIGMLRRTRRRLRSTSQHEQPVDSTADEPTEGRRSNKRRRLNDDAPAEKRSIKYGHYGQVEAGRLQMEIVSNDGGEHQDPRNPGISLGADNMLKMDKSVFCSERTSAGIVMRHVDDTPFSLEKLHVTGPEHGFTAPVREGVVYVAMDIKHLRTYQDPPYYARRGPVHEQPYNRYRGIQASPEQLTLSDALRDPEIASAANRSISPFPRDDMEQQTDEEPNYGAEYLGQVDPETHCDIPSPPDDIQQSSFETRLPFTLISDEDSGPEDTSPQEVLDFRLQRLRRMRRTHDMDDWEPSGPTWSYSRADGTVVHRGASRGEGPRAIPNNMLEALLARARPYLSPSPPPPDPPAQIRMQRTKPIHPAADDPNVRAARFSIKRGKSRITVKFDPPVSGRYMLLKLWAGRSNVDVQSVIAKGYAGPRFFPAMELM